MKNPSILMFVFAIFVVSLHGLSQQEREELLSYHQAMAQVINYHLVDKAQGFPCKGGNACCSTAGKCSLGQGDCDRDSHCLGLLVCAEDSCNKELQSELSHLSFYHLSDRSDFSATDDCCVLRDEDKAALGKFVTYPV